MKFLPVMISLVLMSFCMNGCGTTRTEYIVIPADREVIRVKANDVVTRPIDHWSVPDAVMQEILEKIGSLP